MTLIKTTRFVKRNFLLVILIAFTTDSLHAQEFVKHSPPGFDSVQNSIPHGRLDTIKYSSKTIDASRRALIYTPPGYSEKKKYPVLYLLHDNGGDEKEWYSQGYPEIIYRTLCWKKTLTKKATT